MLEINMEYRKGILFIRFIGNLCNNTIKGNEIENLEEVLNTGMSCVVFNLEELENIDNNGIDFLWNKYQLIKNKGGVSFVCGVNRGIVKRKLKKSKIISYMNEIKDELILLHQN